MSLPLRSHCIAFAIAACLNVPAWSDAFDPGWASARVDKVSKINAQNWGHVTVPVYGTSESGVYAGAELFAGPNKFGTYFAGVLPNGRIVKPAGISAQVGANPLGAVLTPDGRYLITSNDDERESGLVSYKDSNNKGFYSLTVLDTATMRTVSTAATGRFFIGLQATANPSGGYQLWVAGGPDNDVKLFSISAAGAIASAPTSIPIAPLLPATAGYVSNYTPNSAALSGKPLPTGFSAAGAKITFPAGMALSPDGRFLYVACNGDNSVAVIDTGTRIVVRQVAVGFFPYAVSVSADGKKVTVSNWGLTEYKFRSPQYDASGKLVSLAPTIGNQPDGTYVPAQDQRASSISILQAPNADGSQLALVRTISQGRKLDELKRVGGTHPSATAIVRRGKLEALYVTKSNTGSLGVIDMTRDSRVRDVNISPFSIDLDDDDGDSDGDDALGGAYPNAIVASPDGKLVYVAEAGLNSVAVLDTKEPFEPRLIGRIPTGWYPSALALSGDGKTLYVVNAKGVGEDTNPSIVPSGPAPASGIVSDPKVDSNFIFGSVQKVDLAAWSPGHDSVLANNFAIQTDLDTTVVPEGGGPSKKIKHVFFILHENKTFDSMLGNLGTVFGPYASLSYSNRDGTAYANRQYTGVAKNTQLLASKFAAAVNYYSDSEESDAGHQFAASGTATDYTEKTLLVKGGRGLLVNKNFEPEDYPAGGYIFNNAARNGASFKVYGAMIRVVGTDTGASKPTSVDDPPSGLLGYPVLQADKFTMADPLHNLGDVTSPTSGLGQSYTVQLPVLAVLGGNNKSGEPRLDRNYPGYNFNISDQRRALAFIKDFDRQLAAGTLPQFVYIYQPNDHTGGVQAPNSADPLITNSPLQQIADGDVALGMVVNHIMKSRAYYDPETGEGSAIFITYDDAQSSLDHIHPHRTPLIMVSPYAKPGHVAKRHYSTASIVKTEELLLGLPPNNLGDLLATDLRDMFQSNYNGIKAADVPVTRVALADPSPEGRKVWSLAAQIDTSAPDLDSWRLGALARLSIRADELHEEAAKKGQLGSAEYAADQARIYETALRLTPSPAPPAKLE